MEEDRNAGNGSEDSNEYKSEYEPEAPGRKRKYQRKRIIRNQLSEKERAILEKSYQKNRYPTRFDYMAIQKSLKWPSTTRVAKWFNNRRYTERTRRSKTRAPASEITIQTIEKEMKTLDTLYANSGDCDL
jgi:hypothetical protein